MPTEMEPSPAGRIDLAYVRTRFAADRTMLGWIRTSLSLIGFGFTIYKFFEYLVEAGTLRVPVQHAGARHLGITLVALGVVFLMMAFVEYLLFLKRLSRESGQSFPVSTTLIASFVLVMVGLFALLNILYRVGPF